MERQYSFEKIEQEVIALWRKNKDKIDAAIQDSNPVGKERFTFLEGPPTANAPPALHHVEMRVFKDLYTRYKAMQGYKVSRKGGWDCHGLPVEVQVEKKLGLESKKDVLSFGVVPFIDECKRDVFTYIKDWTLSTEKLGFWVDLDNPYVTLHTPYMESVWWALKTIYEKDLLYKGHKIVPYCARCATPLSTHEVAQGYKDVEETTVVVTFPAIDQDYFLKQNLATQQKPATFLAWTTTPWTLPSNLALAVHKDVVYSFVEGEHAIYILAEDLVGKYFDEDVTILGSLKGIDLVGQTYEPLFDYFKAVATNSFRVIEADYVTTEDGTGIVHQAPAFGEDDSLECAKNNIDFVNPVDENGEFTEEVADYAGRFVKDTDKDIIADLEKKGRLFKTFPYVHSYPFCWRCKTPLIYYAKDTWFIAVSKMRDKLIALNDTINWYPKTIKHGRFGHWLEGARDWALSRNKFWGTPLPLWVCSGNGSGNSDQSNCEHDGASEDQSGCGHTEAIGSIAELQEKTGVLVDDLHINTVDPLTYTCKKCGGTMRRTSEVIDTWFDSGSAPFAQLHYPFENKQLFEELFPYDYIAEAIDQTRGWFYTLLVINGILFDKAPFRNVAVGGLLCDDNGEKMSKSKGNIIKPDTVFSQQGVDATRLVMANYSLGNSIRFGDSVFKEFTQPFFTTLWNTYYYVASYFERCNLSGKEVHATGSLEDNWMISKTNTLIKDVTDHMDQHEYNHALNLIVDFVDVIFSKTYIKLIRDRTNIRDTELAYVMRNALDVAVKLLAPFAPYVTEHIYQHFLKAADDPWSVHFTSWPKEGMKNTDLEQEFAQAQLIIQGLLSARDKAAIGVRWPLGEAKIVLKNPKLNEEILGLIRTQTNVKNLFFVDDFPVELSFSVDYKKLGEVFGTETGDVIPQVKKNMDMISKALNESDTVVVDKWTLTRDHFKVEKIVPVPYERGEFKDGEVYLDTTLTDELLAEGFSREITRRVQNLRKKSGLQKEDVVLLNIATVDLEDVVNSYKDVIGQAVGAQSLTLNGETYEHASTEKVKGKQFTISLKKV
jgi:isoleucyl-tRNA synthetase